MNCFKIAGPRTIAEALAFAAEAGDNAIYISGGTDWLVNGAKKVAGGLLIDLTQVEELTYIEERADHLVMGAGVTFSRIATNPLVWEKARCLAQAAAQIGSTQIRNRATIGGNVANAAPAADGVPPLMALDAEVLAIKGEIRRWVPMGEAVSDLCGGLMPGTLFAAFRVPLLLNSVSAFVKLGSRSTVSVAKLNLAARIQTTEDGRSRNVRLAMGAAAANAFRVTAVEKLWEGRSCEEALAEELAGGLVTQVDRLLAGRASLPYKREAIRGLAYDLVLDIGRAVEDGGRGNGRKA